MPSFKKIFEVFFAFYSAVIKSGSKNWEFCQLIKFSNNFKPSHSHENIEEHYAKSFSLKRKIFVKEILWKEVLQWSFKSEFSFVCGKKVWKCRDSQVENCLKAFFSFVRTLFHMWEKVFTFEVDLQIFFFLESKTLRFEWFFIVQKAFQ